MTRYPAKTVAKLPVRVESCNFEDTNLVEAVKTSYWAGIAIGGSLGFILSSIGWFVILAWNGP